MLSSNFVKKYATVLTSIITALISFNLLAFQQILPSQLLQTLEQPSQVIIDIRSEESYKKGHILNAINIPFAKFHYTKNGIKEYTISPTKFQTLASQHGIKNTDDIVIYGDWAYLGATKILWIFEFYGHKKLQLLQKGFQGWQQQKFVLSHKVKKLSPSNYIVQINPAILASKFQVFMATKSNDFTIIDARPYEHYIGKKSYTDKKGHIPNAINHPWFEVLENRDADDAYQINHKISTYKPLKTLKKIFSNIPIDKKIILYCNGGSGSAVIHFALKKVGRVAQIYDGSWYEWSADNKMRIEKGTE